MSALASPVPGPRTPGPGPAVTVSGLRVEIAATGTPVVSDVSLAIARGEILGVVGESGSGKTTVGLAMLGHARRGLRIAGGSVLLGDQDVLALDPARLRRLRGSAVSYVPQDPASALNPALRVGLQLREVLAAHASAPGGTGPGGYPQRIAQMMREVALPDDRAFLRRYPHQLSGGQQQRIGLAMAFANRPRLIVLDEPTTGLDVTTQSHVLSTVRELATLHDVAALYVSHDLAVVSALATRVAVMYAGRLVELGTAEELFAAAAHPYTRRLIGAIPRLTGGRSLTGIPGHALSPGQRPDGCAFAPRCTLRIDECDARLPDLRPVAPDHLVRCVRAELVMGTRPGRTGDVIEMPAPDGAAVPALKLDSVTAAYAGHQVVHSVSLTLAQRECLALVGESGSGKTTIARAIAGLHHDWRGTIALDGAPLQASARQRGTEARRKVQYIFQNPYGSLNPRRTVGQLIEQPLRVFGTASGKEATRRAAQMLERVSLPSSYARRYPDQLSGGERQRVAIARALVCDPTVLVCDEVTSALDVSVQAAIVELLGSLQRELGLSMLFITHNLPLVRSVAQRVAVLRAGAIVELGEAGPLLAGPVDDYTRQLVADTPSLETATAEAALNEPSAVLPQVPPGPQAT